MPPMVDVGVIYRDNVGLNLAVVQADAQALPDGGLGGPG
jgi:hypothetical protein